ncbi:MAG: hypothetical protein NTY46_05965 [Candidatus Sumerlaeota bacterium]|nr:hypothetical protein [Candidatus Sumerlaeota bacterium]
MTAQRPPRLVALDAFRGFVIIGMLFVNNKPAQFHPQFDHAPWGAFPTFTDMIFPWFLFMIGCAIPYAKASCISRGVSRKVYYRKALARAASLFALGCLIYTAINFTSGKPRLAVSFAGVLQPIAAAYLAAVFLYELPLRMRYLVTAGILAAYWLLIRYVPYPGGVPGLTDAKHNILAWINQTLLPPIKLPWVYPKYVGGISFAGLPSVFPMSVLVITGTWAGELMRAPLTTWHKLARLLAMGLILATLGMLWHKSIMMNKDYWTPAYVLFSSGLGMLCLGFLFLIIDIVGWKKWAIALTVFGMNAITAYFVSIMARVLTIDWIRAGAADGGSITLKQALTAALRDWFPWHLGPRPENGTAGDLVFIFAYIGFWWVILFIMYRRKWFWRV